MVICVNSVSVIVTLYALGFIICYFLLREKAKDFNRGEWVLVNKLIVIFLSLLSWFMISVYLVVILLSNTNIIDPDKKCKW